MRPSLPSLPPGGPHLPAPHAPARPGELLTVPQYRRTLEACWQGAPSLRPSATEVQQQLDALAHALNGDKDKGSSS